MALEFDEDIFQTLISSQKIVDSSHGPLVFTFPSLQQKMLAKYYYDKFIKLHKDKIPSFEVAFKDHKANGMWSDEKEEQLLKFPKFIHETTAEIKETKQPSKIKKLKEWLAKLEKSYLEILLAKNAIFANTLEYLANDRSLHYLVFCCFKNIDGSSLWKSYESMLASQDGAFIDELVVLYNQNTQPIEEKELRKIARNPVWRVRWSTSKQNVSQLINRNLVDAISEQFMLIYWSQVYDMAYESLDRPPDEVIKDDEEFNKWLEDLSKKQTSDVKQKFYGKGISRKSKIDNAAEVFRVVDGYYDKDGIFRLYTEEDKLEQINKIGEANSKVTKQILKNELAVLESNKGRFLDETELRRNKNTRDQLGIQTESIKK